MVRWNYKVTRTGGWVEDNGGAHFDMDCYRPNICKKTESFCKNQKLLGHKKYKMALKINNFINKFTGHSYGATCHHGGTFRKHFVTG